VWKMKLGGPYLHGYSAVGCWTVRGGSGVFLTRGFLGFRRAASGKRGRNKETSGAPRERRPRLRHLRRAIEMGERIPISTLVLNKWLRAPRLPCRTLRLLPGREIDLAIAARAMIREAEFWTRNDADFRDIPALRLFAPSLAGPADPRRFKPAR
jgi:predicted nucleic acid-binding protein